MLKNIGVLFLSLMLICTDGLVVRASSEGIIDNPDNQEIEEELKPEEPMKEELEEEPIEEQAEIEKPEVNDTAQEELVQPAAAGTHTVTAVSNCTASDLQELLDLNKNGTYSQLIINIPAGTYRLDQALYVNSNTVINADKNAVLQKQSGYGALLANRLVNDDGGYDGTSNITINGGVWDSLPLKSAMEGTETFRFIHAQNITVSNAVLRNVPEGSHLIVFAGVKNAKVVNSSLYGYGDNGDNYKTPKEAIQLDVAHDNVIVPTLQPVYWDDLPCEDITISGCQFYDFSRGIGSHTAVAGVMHKNITITGNKFWDLEDSAIRLYNYKDTVVNGNTFKNMTVGVLLYTYLEDAEEDAYFQPLNGKVKALPSNYNVTVSNNIMENTKLLNEVWGDGIRIVGSKERPLKGVTVSGNTIKNAARYGIFASHAPELKISGQNNISSTKKHGILLEENSNYSVIAENQLSALGEAGVAVYSSMGVSVTKNTVTAPTESGVYIYKSTNCMVGSSSTSYNTVINSKKYGIYVTTSCDGTKVKYNRISGASSDGIGVYSSRNLEIKNNQISALGNGIYINTNSVNNSIDSNTINSAGKNGIWASSGSKWVSINKNTVGSYGSKGNYAGIYVYKAGGTSSKYDSKITSNKVTGTGKGTSKNGIKISTAPYTAISGNRITTPAGTGIYLYKSANCTIGSSSKDYNTVTSPKKYGIYVTTNCNGAKVQYNRISKAASDGIGVYSSKKVLIKTNQISASGNGIYINTNSTESKIESNTISSAGKNGIWASSGSKRVTINKNTINKYAGKGNHAGIYVFKAGGTSSKYHSKITSNKVTGTGTGTSKDGIKVSTAPYTTISGNRISTPAGAGIYLYKSSNCTIGSSSKDYNTVTSPQKYGIYVTTNCNGTRVQYNRIAKAASDGIGVYSSKKVLVKWNRISASGNGIYINTNSTEGKVDSNTINSAGKNGIWVSSGSKRASINKNTINKYAGKGNYAGIYVYKAGGTSSKYHSKITSNKIIGQGTSKKKDGIKISNASYCMISKNTVSSSPGCGVYLYKSKYNTLSGNKVSNAKSKGMYLTTGCDKAKIVQNTISKSEDTGIATYKTPNTSINDNIVTVKKGKRGIWASTSNKTIIKSNTIKGAAKKNAILVTSSSGSSITKNKIEK